MKTKLLSIVFSFLFCAAFCTSAFSDDTPKKEHDDGRIQKGDAPRVNYRRTKVASLYPGYYIVYVFDKVDRIVDYYITYLDDKENLSAPSGHQVKIQPLSCLNPGSDFDQ